MTLDFTDEGHTVTLQVASPAFDGVPLRADLRVERPPEHETLNVVIPWSESRFQFTSKQHCLPAQGTLQVGDQTITFDQQDAFACLDYGRGVWKLSSFWNWGNFSTRQDGRLVGANLGAGWTDGTGMTENGILLDGKLHKISEDLQWSYDSADFMKPWRITTPESDQIDLEFTPFYERVAATDVVLLKSEVHQMIGHFSGVLKTGAGETVSVEKAVGWAEEHYARW
jgi:hypothetical protein